jgi:hypothetical protein
MSGKFQPLPSNRQTSRRVLTEIEPSDAAAIAELVANKAEYEKAKGIVKGYDAMVKILKDKYGGEDPDVETEVHGDEHILEIGAAGNERKIKNLPLLVKLLGPELFLQLATVKTTDIVKYVEAHRIDEVLETLPSNTRPYSLIKKAA